MHKLFIGMLIATSAAPLLGCNSAGMDPGTGALVGGAGGAAIGAALSRGGVGGTLAGATIGAMTGAMSTGGGMPFGAAGEAAAGSGEVPDTPQCRKYLDYARHAAGPMGTYGPLIDLYHECMNSGRADPRVQRYECAPGSYVHYRGGQKLCGRG